MARLWEAQLNYRTDLVSTDRRFRCNENFNWNYALSNVLCNFVYCLLLAIAFPKLNVYKHFLSKVNYTKQ